MGKKEDRFEEEESSEEQEEEEEVDQLRIREDEIDPNKKSSETIEEEIRELIRPKDQEEESLEEEEELEVELPSNRLREQLVKSRSEIEQETRELIKPLPLQAITIVESKDESIAQIMSDLQNALEGTNINESIKQLEQAGKDVTADNVGVKCNDCINTTEDVLSKLPKRIGDLTLSKPQNSEISTIKNFCNKATEIMTGIMKTYQNEETLGAGEAFNENLEQMKTNHLVSDNNVNGFRDAYKEVKQTVEAQHHAGL